MIDDNKRNERTTEQSSTEKLGDFSKDAVTAIDLMTSLQGLIYKKITQGGEEGGGTENNFFCWATPGIPVVKEDFDFVSQGFRGMKLDRISLENALAKSRAQKVVLDAAKKAAEEAEEEGASAETDEQKETDDDMDSGLLSVKLTEEEVEALRADKTFNLYLQAESLANLVDFIPDVTGWKKMEGAKMRVLEDLGSLSEEYKYALRMSQVKDIKLDEETTKKLEEYRARLVKVEKEEPYAEGLEPIEIVTPSAFVDRYSEYEEKYLVAMSEYKEMQIAALSGNAEDIHRFAMLGKTYKMKVDNALKQWEGIGQKSRYESTVAFIEDTESRSMQLLKDECKSSLRNAYISGICSGQEFPYTTLSPKSFATSGSWTKIEFSESDYNETNYNDAKNSGFHFDAKARYIIASAKGHYDSNSSDDSGLYTFSLKGFKMSFEICQVDIVRPWFKASFLNSRYWRFVPGNDKDENGNEVVEMLSDGGEIPSGRMPAYPTAIVFIRNMVIEFNDSTQCKDFLNQYKNSSWGASGGLDWIFGAKVNVGGSSGSSSHDSTNRLHQMGKKIKVDGMQIVGYRCHLLSKCPDPLPSITDWV